MIVNKIDAASRKQVLASSPRRRRSAQPSTSRCRRRPATAVAALVDHLVALLPEGPKYFPDDEGDDLPEERWVAELVREQLLAVTRDELPYASPRR